MFIQALVVQEFDNFSVDLSEAKHDLTTHVYKVMLVNELPAVSDTTDKTASTYTEPVGPNYNAGGITMTIAPALEGGKYKWICNDQPTWPKNASGVSGVAMVVYNENTNRLVAFADLTQDAGVTPVSTVDGDIRMTFNASGFVSVGRV